VFINPDWPRRDAPHPGGGRELTKQSEALPTDINHIMARWLKTGFIPPAGGAPMSYGEFENASDLHDMTNRVMAARDDFDRLPAHIRDHVGNDPGEFLDLVYDPERRDELVELGLVEAAIPANAPRTESVAEEGAPAPQPAQSAIPGAEPPATTEGGS